MPIGLAEGCIVRREITRDDVLTFDDVDLPEGRVCDRLWREQLERFADELRGEETASFALTRASG